MSPSPSSEPHVGLSMLTQRTVNVNDITPYWRNPRRISEEAVNALAESIERYGYLQPIVVDEKMVIIIGHTRYAAIRRLGYREVTVAVESGLDAIAVKQLRTIDNKTAEYTGWDYEKLVAEIDDLDNNAMRSFFPELVPALDEGALTPKTTDVLEGEAGPDDKIELICPSCFYSWTQKVSIQDIMAGKIEGAKA